MTILVTGAAGFIGSNLVHHLRRRWPDRHLVSFDALTYAGRRENLAAFDEDPLHTFVHADVADGDAVKAAFEAHQPTGVMHLAAESHVDRSIFNPVDFVRTNVLGTATLLHAARMAWGDRTDVRFLHVSTDEVFGSLGDEGHFTEETPYAPSSPYAASKAAADHLVRSFNATYGLPTLITNCSNNYGPYQFPEKLIPVVISRALASEPVPVYGAGDNVRDWLFVEDHCDALATAFERGIPGDTYCIGGNNELRNLDLVEHLLDAVDAALGRPPGQSRALIRFVTDRPGHDFRYAIDASFIAETIGWAPKTSLADGLRGTVEWYLNNREWLQTGRDTAFEDKLYGERLEDE